MKKKMLFIYNANAGKGKIKTYLSDVIEQFCRGDYEVTIYATGGSKEATEMVLARGEEYDVITCSGGDGTINEVIGGIMQLEKKPVCGYLPMGTVNDFASSLQLPKNPVDAAKVITAGKIFSCDVGKFKEQHFNYIAGFGAFTEVAYETPQDLKNVVGRAAYFVDAIKRIPDLRGYEMKVEYDGKMVEGNYIFGMVCNSKSIGGFSLESGDNYMDLDDGLFEVVLVHKPSDVIELEMALSALVTRDPKHPFIDAMRVKSVKFVCEDEVRWTLDGENGGYHKEAEIACIRHGVRIFCPHEN